MTAIVGVMNKHAVALAADSAVTIGGRKVMNSANKIFALSKYNPIAIAVYGNAELIGTPWEIAIKEFRKSLSNKKYATLRQYVDSFFEFLKCKNYYTTTQEAQANLKNSVESFVHGLIQYSQSGDIYKVLKDELNINHSLEITFDAEDERYFEETISPISNEMLKCLSQKGVVISNRELNAALKCIFLNTIPPIEKTGLIFTGYGEDEHFPVLIHCEVGTVINGKLSISKLGTIAISKDTSSSICPFAQTDVMQTILDGIAPQVQDEYTRSLEDTLNKVIESLIQVISPRDSELAKQISELNLNSFKLLYLKLSTESRRKQYTDPFVGSVAGLEKEDLADFAESLIKLTSIKRKVSMEQDSVGGPTDVMLISKGDGIIWKRRKHYFDKELNHHFFENYFND